MAERQMLPTFFKKLMRRTGGYYLPIGVMGVQVLTDLLIAPVVAFVQNNADMGPAPLKASVQITSLLTITNDLIIASVIFFFFVPNAFRRLESWRKGSAMPIQADVEAKAWHEITHLPWRYGFFGLASSLIVVVIPLIAYQFYFLHLRFDQIIYTLLGGVMGVLSVVTAGVTGIEWLSQPAREVLLPSDFELQAKHVRSLSIFWKLQIFIIGMVSLGIIAIAPLGYHEIVQIVGGEDAAQALQEYQLQSLIITLIILVVTALMTAMVAYLFSAPFGQLANIFPLVEQGHLNQRVQVASSDEAGELEIYFNRMISNLEILQGSLERQVDNRTAQLSAVIEVGRAASAILDSEELIQKVINLITDRFGHYYAAIFLLDASGHWAELKNATGEAGRVLRDSHHRLAVDSRSMVGAAISQKQARIALDVGLEPVRFNNPLLPYTRSEIALPLIVGDRVLGVLDIQSTREAAFGDEDIETFQSMAGQVAIALENARLFQETRQRLQELQITQRQYLHEAWQTVSSQERLEYGVGDETPLESGSSIEVPLALRNEVIGKISVTGKEEWSAEERAWVESVATQASIALENARLMEENRKQAIIERLVAEITTRIWSASNMDGILQTAAREIGRALNLSEATVSLHMDQQGAKENE